MRVLKFTTLSQLTEITKKKRTIIFWGLKVKIELLLEANLCDYRGVILILEILMTWQIFTQPLMLSSSLSVLILLLLILRLWLSCFSSHYHHFTLYLRGSKYENCYKINLFYTSCSYAWSKMREIFARMLDYVWVFIWWYLNYLY